MEAGLRVNFNQRTKHVTLLRAFAAMSNTWETIDFSDFAITKTRLYNFDPCKPHFDMIKLGFAGVYIIFYYFA